jgi:hypothetical protein
MGTGDFSVCVWAKRATIGAIQQIISYGDDDGIHWYIGYHSDNKIRFRTDDTSTDTSTYSTSTVADTNWYHVAVTFDRNGDTKFYIDGVLDNTTDHSASSSTLTHASDGLLIGTRNSGGSYTQHYNGYMCNVGLWSTALTQAQIKSIMWKNYAGLTSSETTNLVSWWNLDDPITGTEDKVGETYGSELITNGTMEADDNWSDYGTVATDGNVRSSDQAHSGTYSRKFITGDGTDGIQSDTFATVTGETYKVSFWVYSAVDIDISLYALQGDGSGSNIDSATDTLTAGAWQNVVRYFTESSGGSSAGIIIYNPTGAVTQYIDDVSVKLVTSGNPGVLK